MGLSNSMVLCGDYYIACLDLGPVNGSNGLVFPRTTVHTCEFWPYYARYQYYIRESWYGVRFNPTLCN